MRMMCFCFCFFVVLECTHDHLTSVYTEFVSFIYFSFISFGVGLFLYENQENKKKTEISINIQNHLIFSKKIKNIFCSNFNFKMSKCKVLKLFFFLQKKKQSWWDNNNERIRD